MKKSNIVIASILPVITCLAVAAFAASDAKTSTNKGATPNGKPFVALNQRVDDLQTQINDLVGTVSSLEGRVLGLENAVDGLLAQTAALDAEIEALAVDVEANELKIVELGSQIVENQNMIALMQDEIAHIQAELATKQNIISGTCSPGSALREIRADGSVVCASTQHDIAIHKYTVTNAVTVPKGEYTEQNCNYSWFRSNCYNYTVKEPQTRTASVACPEGSLLISGSTQYNGLTLRSQGESPIGTWTATATNYSSSDHHIFVTAICVGAEY